MPATTLSPMTEDATNDVLCLPEGYSDQDMHDEEENDWHAEQERLFQEAHVCRHGTRGYCYGCEE